MLTHLSIIIESLVSDFLNLRPAIPQDPLWAFNEFAGADFNDLRLTERLQYLQTSLKPAKTGGNTRKFNSSKAGLLRRCCRWVS